MKTLFLASLVNTFAMLAIGALPVAALSASVVLFVAATACFVSDKDEE